MEINDLWEIKLIEEARRIVKHGFGKMDLQASNPKGLLVRVVIWSGCSHVFIVKKELNLDKMDIL